MAPPTLPAAPAARGREAGALRMGTVAGVSSHNARKSKNPRQGLVEVCFVLGQKPVRAGREQQTQGAPWCAGAGGQPSRGELSYSLRPPKTLLFVLFLVGGGDRRDETAL